MKHSFQLSVTPWVILGAIIIAGALSVLLILGLSLVESRHQSGEIPAIITVIPAPTMPPTSVLLYTSTPEITTIEINGISLGKFVQIAGTGGDGLRLRAGPGKGFAPLFLGYESEVFEVKDGPKFSDGITWWYLVAPYDETRSGWAAADYLKVVNVELEGSSP